MKKSYELVKKFKNNYPMTIAWRINKHCKVIDKHLNDGEKILYVFTGQKNEGLISLFSTYVIAFTNKRIILATKRVLFGYFFKSITPDMYNDLTIHRGIIWGRIQIDTVKEVINIINLDINSLDEIETNVSEIMLKHKKEFMALSKDEKGTKK